MKTFLNTISYKIGYALQVVAPFRVRILRRLKPAATRARRHTNLIITLILVAVLTTTTSCEKMLWPWSELWKDDNKGGSSTESSSPTTPAIEATATYSIALGGVAPGRDELILTDDNGNLLDLGTSRLRFESDTDVVGLLPRPDYNDFASGSGAQIVPQKVGFAVVTYYIDDVEQDDQLMVIVPPQSLIQMMVAEAGTQLADEAEIDSDSHVKLSSTSPTANGIGSVTRNRVDLISEDLDHSLFGVNEAAWLAYPPSSYYDSVITAESGGIYQYSPVDPSDPTHDIYTDAEARGFLDESHHRAYDQAVLSASYLFAEKTDDTTDGAFAFFSPTPDEWEVIEQVYANNMITIPAGCGFDDLDFPTFAPIQMLIHPDVWRYDDGRPAFIFIRSRDPLEYAVVK